MSTGHTGTKKDIVPVKQQKPSSCTWLFAWYAPLISVSIITAVCLSVTTYAMHRVGQPRVVNVTHQNEFGNPEVQRVPICDLIKYPECNTTTCTLSLASHRVHQDLF